MERPPHREAALGSRSSVEGHLIQGGHAVKMTPRMDARSLGREERRPWCGLWSRKGLLNKGGACGSPRAWGANTKQTNCHKRTAQGARDL